MRLEIASASDIGQARWDASAEDSDEAWLWHRSGFQYALAAWPGREDRSFAVVDGSGLVSAVVPLHVVRRSVLPGVRVSRLDSHGGPATRQGLSERQRRKVLREAVRHILAVAERCRALEVSVRLPALAGCRRRGDVGVNPLVPLGFADRSTPVWVLDLVHGDRQSAWENLQSGTRAYIEEHRDLVHIRDAVDDGDVDIYYDLHQATFRRTGVAPHPREYFARIWARLVPDRSALPLIAEVEGRPVAAAVFGWHRGGANYWMGASLPQGQAVRANDVLQWAAIERMIDAGLDMYELGPAYFGATDSKLAGISFFKSKFASGVVSEPRGAWDTAGPIGAALRAARTIVSGHTGSSTPGLRDRSPGQRYRVPW